MGECHARGPIQYGTVVSASWNKHIRPALPFLQVISAVGGNFAKIRFSPLAFNSLFCSHAGWPKVLTAWKIASVADTQP